MNLNIGYFGHGKWSIKTLKKLINDPEIKISFICGRYNSKDINLKKYATKYGINYLENKNVNSKKFLSIIKKYNCDLFISISFDQIFKNKIINLAKYKTINCHAGKLPFYRGRNILNWVLINDEKEFGITVHYVNEKIDRGNIILQRLFKITDKDDYKTLLEKSYVECANIIKDTIIMFKENKVKSYSQSKKHPLGFYCSKRKNGDEIIDWNQTSRELFNFVRAICKPGPIARTFINKKEMKINKTEFLLNAPNYKCIVGTVLEKNDNNFVVKTKDNYIKITEYEYDGKIKIGDKFEVK